MSKESQSFESSMERLEEIVRKIEMGNVPLEESLKLFEEGTKLIGVCSKLLNKAELKVAELAKTPDEDTSETEWKEHDES